MPKLRWVDDDKARNAVSNVVMKILREDKSLSYGDPKSGNILVHGDNLEALKALLPFYAGRVKCIYIDPPYNTKSAFPDYDDNLEHSIWLGIMYPRLKLLREFLREDGCIWISIDDHEGAYLKVVCDEVFKRPNFVIQTTIQRGAATGHKAINPTPVQVSDYMLTYAKNKSKWTYHPVYVARGYDKAYNKYIINPDDPYEEWKFGSLKELERELGKKADELIKTESARIIRTAQPDYNAVGEETRKLIDASIANPQRIFVQHRIDRPDIYLKDGERILFYKDKMKMVDGKLTTAELATSIWTDMNYQGIAKEGGVKFSRSKKPESQIARVLEMSTEPGDLVMDVFLGSGTTAAVAHKMGRRWLGVEMGDHCKSLCLPRLKDVVDGSDKTGVTKRYAWQGGGGFKFYELGEPLLDENGAISEGIDFDTLAAHIWWRETGSAWDVATRNSTFLGVHDGVAYAMLYNGVLHDRSYAGGNVLTPKTMRIVREDIGAAKYGRLVVYGECTKLGAAKLREENVEFRQTPYDIVTRR